MRQKLQILFNHKLLVLSILINLVLVIAMLIVFLDDKNERLSNDKAEDSNENSGAVVSQEIVTGVSYILNSDEYEIYSISVHNEEDLSSLLTEIFKYSQGAIFTAATDSEKDTIGTVIEDALGSNFEKEDYLFYRRLGMESFILIAISDNKLNEAIFFEHKPLNNVVSYPSGNGNLPEVGSVKILLNGQESDGAFALAQTEEITVEIQKSSNVNLDSCQFKLKSELDDANLTVREEVIPSVLSQKMTLPDGYFTFILECNSNGNQLTDTANYNGYILEPKLCKDYNFSQTDPTVTNVDELKDDIVGKWAGCEYDGWSKIPYWVEIEFKSDGTYTAVSNEIMDGYDRNAMYYGSEDNHPNKKYSIESINTNKIGNGEIDIYFGPASTVTGDLRNIKLTDNNQYLSFEFFHRGQYGPFTYKLKRL